MCETPPLTAVSPPLSPLTPHPPFSLQLVEGVPHGLLMKSETQQMLLLVPNVRLHNGSDDSLGANQSDDVEVFPVRDDFEWEQNATVRRRSIRPPPAHSRDSTPLPPT